MSSADSCKNGTKTHGPQPTYHSAPKWQSHKRGKAHCVSSLIFRSRDTLRAGWASTAHFYLRRSHKELPCTDVSLLKQHCSQLSACRPWIQQWRAIPLPIKQRSFELLLWGCGYIKQWWTSKQNMGKFYSRPQLHPSPVNKSGVLNSWQCPGFEPEGGKKGGGVLCSARLRDAEKSYSASFPAPRNFTFTVEMMFMMYTLFSHSICFKCSYS